jgi:hypothetical protein
MTSAPHLQVGWLKHICILDTLTSVIDVVARWDRTGQWRNCCSEVAAFLEDLLDPGMTIVLWFRFLVHAEFRSFDSSSGALTERTQSKTNPSGGGS